MWKKNEVEKILSISRDKIGKELDLIDKNQFAFCWIVDYPMFEIDEQTKILSLVTILFQCLKEI